MKKCKCIKESKWFTIDDSFDENSQIKGGSYTFNVDEEYDFFTEDTFYGICYTVIHDVRETGFDEMRFNNHFKAI